MNPTRFIHLNVHSDYSIIDGLSKPEDLIKQAVNLGMISLAITDFNNFFGVIKFYNIAHKLGIKPIIGVTVNFLSEFIKSKLVKITLLATNQKGYQNLILLISCAYQKGYLNNYNLAIEKKWLIKYKEGIILLSGGCQGEMGQVLLSGNLHLISLCTSFYKKYFSNYYYLEIHRTQRKNEEKYINLAVNLSIAKNIPLVATNDVCFLNKEDFDVHKIRIAIHEGCTLKNSMIQNDYSNQQFLKTEKEMCALFSDIPEALINTIEIGKRCNVFIYSGKYFLPTFLKSKQNINQYLIRKANQGIKIRLNTYGFNQKKYNKIYKIYKERLDTELKIITEMDFSSYFLIVMEFIKWSKDNNIPVGPGRGSGSSSLVAYVLNITEVDPLLFDLVFERFLNPERISMPDFDIDFCMDKRDQVIEHVSKVYGKSSVAQIITFGTLTAKAVIRDVGRVLGYPYGFINKLSKLIPLDPGITLRDAFSRELSLSNFYKNNDDVKRLIDVSLKLEGVNRNVGKHAGGVVISPTKITDFCPLYYDEKGKNPVTQFDKNDIEYVGLVKFDFLGLKTLTIISDAVDMINKKLRRQGKKNIDIHKISLNEEKCFNLLKKSKTTGIFQLESYGMRDLIKKLQPDCFQDIIALVALFRPGPLQSGMVDNFINRKHGREHISYPDKKWQHDLLKPILQSTYGIILYQEQVMKIAQVLAGYTLGAADILRRAMSKKNIKDMAKQRVIFEQGAKKNKIDKHLSIKIFNLLEKFAGYGFNKAHSVAYALLSYQTLWLKTYYTSEFMASAMTSDIDNTEKIVVLIHESWSMNLRIQPPCINLSKYKFYVNKDNYIVYGLGAIKGIGVSSVENIVKEREKNGHFNNLFDFCCRTDAYKIPRKILEKLIMSGSFDCFNFNRQYLLLSMDDVIKASKEYIKIQNYKQKNLFGILKDELNLVKSYDKYKLSDIDLKQKKLEQEYQMLGLYLTDHPINQYFQELEYYIKGIELFKLSSVYMDKPILISGIILSIKIKITKNKNRIAIIILDDNTSRIEVIIFTKLLDLYESMLKLNQLVFIKGTINKNFKMIAYNIMKIDMIRKIYIKKLVIILQEEKIDNSTINALHECLEKQSKGFIPIEILYSKKNINLQLELSKKWSIIIDDNIFKKLIKIAGLTRIKLHFHCIKK